MHKEILYTLYGYIMIISYTSITLMLFSGSHLSRIWVSDVHIFSFVKDTKEIVYE